MFRLLLAAVLVVLLVVAPVTAQTEEATPPPAGSSTVTVTFATGMDGTVGPLRFELSGTFLGDPFPMTLPGGLAPGSLQTFSFLVPYPFCDLFQYRLTLEAGVTDSWTGVVRSVAINDLPVWINNEAVDDPDVSPLTAGGFKGGTWDQTAEYGRLCPLRPFDLVLTTGPAPDDGTVNNFQLSLTGPFSASPYRRYLDQPGDLLPGMTNSYALRVPMPLCAVDGWRIDVSGADPADTWLPTAIYLTFDGSEVFFDTVFAEVGPLSPTRPASGAWTGTAAYQTRCGPGAAGGLPIITVVPIQPIVTLPPPVVQPELIITAPPLLIDPGLIITAPPLQIVPGVIQIVPTPTPTLPLLISGIAPLVVPTPALPTSQCPGFLPSRLVAGGQGRVTPGAPNRLRDQPAMTGVIIGTLPGGAPFVVIRGPQCDPAGIAWWQINYNGLIGWTAEGQGNTYFTEPVTP